MDKRLLVLELASGYASCVSQIGVHLSRLQWLRYECGFWPHGLHLHHDIAVNAIGIINGGIIRASSAARHEYGTASRCSFRTQHLSLRRGTHVGVQESQIEQIKPPENKKAC